ncbi:MAG: SpoIIE family protein phosphatase [Phycisphaeraceae bacterium]|nr:SpoIIE family protein phosphatase [Phycisphaerales bacterium]MCB9858925.1 SpoIIE family protein phosphatase [Phycisphaeraceae bacterium]
MSLRAKLLTALLLASLLPMVIMMVVGQGSLRLLGSRIASEQRKDLLNEAMQRLQYDTERIAETFNRSTRQIISGCIIQQLELEQMLANEPNEANRVFLMTSNDFAENATLEMVLHPEADKNTRPDLMVAYDRPVVDPRGDSADDDALRLASLTVVLNSIYFSLRDIATWQFAVLKSGSSAWYPGTQLPDGFDARELPFMQSFLQQIAAGVVNGNGVSAFRDPLTGKVLVGLARFVHDPEGNYVGVTGVLVSVNSLQSSFTPNRVWQRDSQFYIIARNGLNEKGEPFIIAHPGHESSDVEQGERLKDQFFSLDTPEDTKLIVDALQNTEVTIHHVTKNGREMLASAAAIDFARDSDVGIITMIPKDVVTRHADNASKQILRNMKSRLIANLGIIAGVLGIVIISTLLGVRRLTQPINHLMDAARRIASGDLDAKADVQTGDELQELAETFNTMTPRLRDHMRVRSALDLAMEVQQHLLPAVAPNVPGLELAGKSIPCDEVGGDYYDFLEVGPVDDGRVGIAIGDVTGHGIAAALLMTSARAMLRSRAGEHDVAETMARRVTDINRQLAADVSHGRFMTLCWMLMDGQARTLQWVCAGHDPTVLISPKGTIEHLHGSGIPLGIEPHFHYEQFKRTSIQPGSVIMLGTDGIWEARNAAGEMFGKSRMEKVIHDHISRSASDILDALVDAVNTFRGDADALDDITLVVAKFV